MSEEFSLVDCCVAPILWRLPSSVSIFAPASSPNRSWTTWIDCSVENPFRRVCHTRARDAPLGPRSHLNSSRPYIIRAIYEWIVDNDCTPHLLVDVEMEGVEVPQAYVSDGQIVLNVSPTAVVGLDMGNDYIYFNGRFGGVATDITVPIKSILGIYARENGQGMVFDTAEDPDTTPNPPACRGRPSLKVVK